jgi:crotonobetainyl-CoA:carnitine CoA-transferase CaiB-like acyl-CoA transferase
MGVLDGIRIIEIAGIGPGPFCGMLLAAPAPRFSATPSGAPAAVPRRGEHGADILRAAGFCAEEIGQLLPHSR